MDGLGQAAGSLRDAERGDCYTNEKATTTQDNSVISTLRLKLWHKHHGLKMDAAVVEQALADLKDPVVQKVLNILHLAG